MRFQRNSLYWRVFAVNAGLLLLIAILLIATPVEISAPIRFTQALVVVATLVVALAANAVLLRRAVAPLERLARRMDIVDLLRPGQRLPVTSDDEVGHVVRAFNEMLDRLELERRQSGRRALEAQEAERVAIARNLHDEVGQLLTGVLLQLDSIAGAVPDQADAIHETKHVVRDALDEVRRISQELRPEVLEQLGLASALTELCERFQRLSGLPVERTFDADLPALDPDAELAIYRIAQEALTNVARHAEATRVSVSLTGIGSAAVLEITDDGRGFPGRGTPSEHGGIRGMRERALLVGAALAVRPGADRGVVVRLEVPGAPAPSPARVAG
jgi:two-component system sensor histidine kinase UhpB